MEEIFLEVTWAGDMKVRKDLGQYTSPRGKGGHSKETVPYQGSLLNLFPVPFSGGRPGCKSLLCNFPAV